MPSPVTCPSCGERLDIPADLRGTPVRCAACASVFTPPPAGGGDDVPAVRPARPAARPAPPADDEYIDDRDRPRRKRGTGWVWLLFGALGLTTCACCGGCGALLWYVENPTFQPHADAAGRFTAEFPGPTTPRDRALNGKDLKIDLKGVRARRDMFQEEYFVQHGEVTREHLKRGEDQLLQDVADALLAAEARPGQVTGKQPTAHAGYPAVDVHVEAGPFQTGMVARVVLAGKRVYVVGVSGQVMPESPRVDHFFQAFKVTDPADAKKDAGKGEAKKSGPD